MENKITQAVILSAGLGTRLRPITDNIPKVMVPLAGKPLLERHILQFKKYGVNEFFVNLHYLPDAIKNHFGNGSKWGVRIHYAFEPEIRGTAGGVKQFEPLLGETFFVIYGDMYSELDYGKMAEAFVAKPADTAGMMTISENDHPHDSDLVEVADDLRFFKVHAKPHKELPATRKALDAAYIFRKKILKYIPAGKYYEIDHMLLPEIIARGEKFYGYETGDFLYDIGTMERYETVERRLADGHG
ncbi:MAG TPA: nucleotidyltransferase family protein [Candidatus Paceibacterota bacterium]|nr:nucleotidyltransferase family protein [Candidatus Paceibacterota bacterium]